jgi:hypothetical protein
MSDIVAPRPARRRTDQKTFPMAEPPRDIAQERDNRHQNQPTAIPNILIPMVKRIVAPIGSPAVAAHVSYEVAADGHR